jgi:putative transposase
MVAAAIRTILAQADAEHVRFQLDVIAGMLGRKFPKVQAMLRDAEHALLAFPAFHPPARLNKEIERRTDVVGVFPNPEALLQLAGAVLVEARDECQVSNRRCLSKGSTALLNRPNPAAKEVAQPALIASQSPDR